MAPLKVAVPEPEQVELLPIEAVQLGEVAVEVVRVEQTGLELRDRRPERVGKAGEARRAAELTEPRRRDDVPEDKRALGIGHDPPAAVSRGDALEDVVERPDRAAEQCPRPAEQ